MDLNFSYDKNQNNTDKKQVFGSKNQRIAYRRNLKRNATRKSKKETFNKKFKTEEVPVKKEVAASTPTISSQELVVDKEDLIETSNDHHDPGDQPTKSQVRLFKDLDECEAIQLPSDKVVELVEEIFDDTGFASLNELHPYLVKNLKDEGKEKMTKVQSESLPHVLNGRDVLIKAQTGSGKTLTYAVPILNSLGSRTGERRVSREDGPYAIIICPTRELSLQSFDSIEKLAQKTFGWVVPGIVNGGLARKAEKKKLKRGINILVGTPGRLYDHMKQSDNLKNFLEKIEYLVIDEADRLFEQTFEDQVREIIQKIKTAKESGLTTTDNSDSASSSCSLQTILLSATLSPGVETLAGLALTNPVTIDLGSNSVLDADDYKSLENQQFTVPKDLDQYVCFCPLKTRFIILQTLVQLRMANSEKTVVFFSTIEEVVHFSNVFKYCDEILPDRKHRSRIISLHGNMDQTQRNDIYRKFKEADRNFVLFSTDVTERGLHFNNVKWIIQYNPAPSIRGYVHRVGRTARIGETGKSVVIMSPSQEAYLKNLNSAGIKVEMVQVGELLNDLYGKTFPTSGKGLPQKTRDRNSQNQKEAASKIQKYYQDYVNDPNNGKVKIQAIDTYQQFLRAYMTCRKELGFIAKDLHFGHLAKTFGLVDPPRDLVKKVRDLNWVKNGPKRPERGSLKSSTDKNINPPKSIKPPKKKLLESDDDGKESIDESGDVDEINIKRKEEQTDAQSSNDISNKTKMSYEAKLDQKMSHEKSKLHFPEFQKKKHLVDRPMTNRKSNLHPSSTSTEPKKSQRTITVDNEVRRARAQKQMNRAKIVERSKADEFGSGFLDRKSRTNYAGKSNMAKRK